MSKAQVDEIVQFHHRQHGLAIGARSSTAGEYKLPAKTVMGLLGGDVGLVITLGPPACRIEEYSFTSTPR